MTLDQRELMVLELNLQLDEPPVERTQGILLVCQTIHLHLKSIEIKKSSQRHVY